MVPLDLTCLHCLHHYFFEHLFNLYYTSICLKTDRQTDRTFIDVNYIVFCQNIKYIYKIIKAIFHGINSYIITLISNSIIGTFV